MRTLRTRASPASACSSVCLPPRTPSMPPEPMLSMPPRRSALLRVYHSAPAQPSAPAAQILPRSTQARPMHTFSHTTASISSAPHKNLPCIRLHERMPGEVFLCCFLFPYLISGSKLGFSSFSVFSAGASTVLGSSTFVGSSSFFSSFLTKEDFLPFCAAAASIDSVD